MDARARAYLEQASGCQINPNAVAGLHHVSCPTDEEKVALLEAAAWSDAKWDPRVRAIAVSIARGLRSLEPRTLAPALHAAVKQKVRYVGEGIETFQAAADTWEWGLGDCDDSARLLAALARSLGLKADIPGAILRNKEGAPTHASVRLWDGTAMRWAETTIDARFGEAPRDALRRLRQSGKAPARWRADIGGVDMAGVEVPKTLTPLSEVDLEVALHEGHVQAFGTDPTIDRLGVAWAHCAHENARGKAIWNNNFGNIGATPSFQGNTFPVDPSQVQDFGSPHMRAFDTPTQGAAGYWSFLAHNYAEALALFDVPDPIGAVHELKKKGYFTAAEAPYAKGVCQLFNEYAQRRLPEGHGPPCNVSGVMLGAGLASAASVKTGIAIGAIGLAVAGGVYLWRRYG